MLGTRKLTDVTLVDLITSRLLRSRLSILFLYDEDHPSDSEPRSKNRHYHGAIDHFSARSFNEDPDVSK